MLAYFLTALESAENRHRFTELYQRYHAKMEQSAISILKKLG